MRVKRNLEDKSSQFVICLMCIFQISADEAHFGIKKFFRLFLTAFQTHALLNFKSSVFTFISFVFVTSSLFSDFHCGRSQCSILSESGAAMLFIRRSAISYRRLDGKVLILIKFRFRITATIGAAVIFLFSFTSSVAHFSSMNIVAFKDCGFIWPPLLSTI